MASTDADPVARRPAPETRRLPIGSGRHGPEAAREGVPPSNGLSLPPGRDRPLLRSGGDSITWLTRSAASGAGDRPAGVAVERMGVAAPLDTNASAAVDASTGIGAMGSTPPAWKRLAAKAAGAVCAAAGPSAARKTRGRAPVAARYPSDRARNASYASSRRTRGRPWPFSTGAGSRSTGFSARFGNSLTPVMISCRRARFSLRISQVAASRARTRPERNAAC